MSTPPPESSPTMFGDRTWGALATQAETGLQGQGAVVESMRRLTVALDAQAASADKLGGRLLYYTIVICVLTAILCALTILLAWPELVKLWGK
jgi:hypothetical protein